MAFLGKLYKFEKGENFEGFIDSLGIPPEISASMKAYIPEQKFEKDGDTYTFYTTTSKGSINFSFKNGVEFDEKIANKIAKTTITINGNTVTQIQKYDDGLTVKSVREYSDDHLKVTLTNSAWDGEAYRYYKA